MQCEAKKSISRLWTENLYFVYLSPDYILKAWFAFFPLHLCCFSLNLTLLPTPIPLDMQYSASFARKKKKPYACRKGKS